MERKTAETWCRIMGVAPRFRRRWKTPRVTIEMRSKDIDAALMRLEPFALDQRVSLAIGARRYRWKRENDKKAAIVALWKEAAGRHVLV